MEFVPYTLYVMFEKKKKASEREFDAMIGLLPKDFREFPI